MHLCTVFIFLLVCKLEFSQSLLSLDEEVDLKPSSQNALRTVVHKFFTRTDRIIVQWGIEFCSDKMLWILNFDIPKIIRSICNENSSQYNLFDNFSGYILIVSVDSNITSDIDNFLKCYYNSYLWQNKSEVLINVIDNGSVCKPYSDTDFVYIFNHLWVHFGILNSIVLTTYTSQCNMSTNEKVWIYNPFVTDRTISGTVHSFSINENFNKFLNRRVKNMNGYPIRITMFPYNRSNNNKSYTSTTPVYRKGGVDMSFKWLMAWYFNLTPVIHAPFDGDTYGYIMDNNGSYSGAVGEIQRGLTDMTLNSKFIRWYNVNNIDYTYPIYSNTLCLVVRKSSQVTGWDIIVKTFHWKVWISGIIITALCCVFSVLIYFIQNHSSENITVWNLIDITCFVWKPLLSVPVVHIPKSSTMRILMGSCFLCGTVIVTVILGQIYNSVRIRQHYPNINTLGELYNSRLDVIISYKGLLDTFLGYESKIMVGLTKRLKIDPKATQDLIKYLQKNNVAVLTTELTIKYHKIINENTFKTGLHRVRECPRGYHLAYMLPKGSVYFEMFNTMIARVHDAGLFDVWLEDTYAFRKESSLNSSLSENKERTIQTDAIRKLTYKDLDLHFFLLYCGLFMSLAVFVLELIWYRLGQYFDKHKTKCKFG